MIDVGFLDVLKALEIDVRPAPERFTADGVEFADGARSDFDVVVAATGFDSGLRRLLDVPDAVGDDGQPRVRSGRPTPHPGLYFIGFDETTRGRALRGPARVDAPRQGGPALPGRARYDELSRNVQRLNSTNATGVTMQERDATPIRGSISRRPRRARRG